MEISSHFKTKTPSKPALINVLSVHKEANNKNPQIIEKIKLRKN